MVKSKFIVDGHVHVYGCYDLDKFFQAALANLGKYAASLYPGEKNIQEILLFTEGRENDFFTRFKNNECSLKMPGYKFERTKEESSLALTVNGKPLCYILKGRQIVTRENLEILAAASDRQIADGLPIRDAVKQIIDREEIAVLAWGVGKWFFKRGKIIAGIINELRSPYLFIGDNSARPTYWRKPALFKSAEKASMFIINGSDPLPFAGEENKVGAYGFTFNGDFDPQEPARSFRTALLANAGDIRFFGSRDTLPTFFKRQVKMFLKKRAAHPA